MPSLVHTKADLEKDSNELKKLVAKNNQLEEQLKKLRAEVETLNKLEKDGKK